MKNKITNYTFADDYHLHVQLGKTYYVLYIENEDIENCYQGERFCEVDSPKECMRVNKFNEEDLIVWYLDTYADSIEPIAYEETVFFELDQQKATRKQQSKALLQRKGRKTRVILPTTYQSTGHGFIQMPSPEYIRALVDRLEQAEQRIQTLEAHLKEQRDIALTTAQIQELYGITPKTINQARTHGRIKGYKINGKEWGYPQKEVDRYIENSKGYFRNVS